MELVLNDSQSPYSGLDYISAEERSESFHQEFGFALIIFLVLILLTILFLWVFKYYRIRLFHETGVAMIMGIIFGLFLHLYFKESTSLDIIPTLQLCDLQSRVETLEIHLTALLNLKCDEIQEWPQLWHKTNKYYIRNLPKDVEFNPLSIHYSFTKDDIIWIDYNETKLEISVRRVVSDNELPEDRIEALFIFNPEIFFYILLPPIIFNAGFSLKKRHFFRNIFSLLTYAFIGTTISTFVIGSILYAYVLIGFEDFPKDFSIIHGLLFGSLISATDPVTILAIFHDIHVDVDLYALVFGESVMNDAVAIVLYRSIDQFEQSSDGNLIWWQILVSLGRFIGIFLGSFLLGTFIGLSSAIVLKVFQLREQPIIETSFFVLVSFFTFPLAEAIQLTGIVAILFCGVAQSHYTYINLSEDSRKRTKDVFELLSFLSENFLFSYMGVSLFTFPYHQWKPGFIGFAFLAIVIGRVLNIIPLSLFLNIRRRRKIPWTFQAMLLFAGLRGAIAFAIAIRNTDNEIRQLFYTTTLIIVLITVVVCGGCTYFALILLRIRVGVTEDRIFREEGEIISYDPLLGNYIVSRFTYVDKNILIPLFTNRGISLMKLCPQWSHFIIRYFDRNKVYSDQEAPIENFNFLTPQAQQSDDLANNEINKNDDSTD